MLALLRARALSAAELGREIGISQASASYHLRQLAGAGMVELAEQRMHRGGRERRYRRRDLTLPAPNESERLAFMRVVLSEAERKLELADLSKPASTGDEDVWIDAETWPRFVARMRRLLGDVEAAGVVAGTPGAIRVSASVLLFAVQDEGSAG